MEALKKMRENTARLNKQIEDAKTKMREESKQYIEEACKELFDACPEIAAIAWTQYSPYFNDGEECYFSVHESIYVLEEDMESWEDDPSFYEGSVITDKSDVESAKTSLEDAILYEKSADEYRNARFGADVIADLIDQDARKDKNDWRYRRDWRLDAKPYYSVSTAQHNLEKTKVAYEKYADRGDTILAHVTEVQKFIASIDEDVMESLFGNHVAITITRDGMEIDEYDHY